MSIRALLLATTILGAASAAQAADLIVEAPTAPIDTTFVDSGIYVQLLGGFVAGTDIIYFNDGEDNGSYPTDAGYAVAGTIGVVVMDGVSLEADVMHASRDYADSDNDTYSTTSLMANAKYTLHLNDTFSLYGAVGLGYVWGMEDYGSGTDEFGSFGYQVIAGVGMKLTDTITGLVEYRYQDTFDKNNSKDYDDYGLSIPNSTILAGLKFSF